MSVYMRARALSVRLCLYIHIYVYTDLKKYLMTSDERDMSTGDTLAEI